MNRSMPVAEGPARAWRRIVFSGSYLDLIYRHCTSNGQVVTVDMVEEIPVEKSYSVQRGGVTPRRDEPAVPRQLPALPPALALPQDTPHIVVSPAVPEPDSQLPETAHDEYGENMLQRGEQFGFEMVRKAMELGLNLAPEMHKSE